MGDKPLKLRLSERKHVPALFLDNSKVAFPIWAYGYVSKVEHSNLLLDEIATHALAEVRCGYSRPPFSLKGKTVLDLGACLGETAWYYLKILGASKVYAVECDSQRIPTLKENKERSGLNMEIIAEPFKLEHLALPHDFIKCDIEGHEDLLIDYMKAGGVLKPCVLEVHGAERKARFEANGFSIVKNLMPNELWIMSNFSTVKQ